MFLAFFTRVISGQRRGWIVFFTLASLGGIAFSALSVAGYSLPVWALVAVGGGIATSSIAVAYIRGKVRLLPDDVLDTSKYTCAFCTSNDLEEAIELTRPSYGREFVEFNVAEQWRIKNPKAFVMIRDNKGSLCACFGILGLSDSFIDQFIAGNITDHQLRACDVLSFDETKKAEKLYISGVVVRSPSTVLGSRYAVMMIWAMLCFLRDVFTLYKPRSLLAIAVTAESERLMSSLGFELLREGKHRKDKCNLYKYEVTKASWKKLENQIPNYKNMCDLQL